MEGNPMLKSIFALVVAFGTLAAVTALADDKSVPVTTKVVVERLGEFNGNFYVNRQLIADKKLSLSSDFSSMTEENQAGGLASGLLHDILDLNGVEYVNVGPYELHVRVSKAFSWKDFEPKVIAILEKAFGGKVAVE